MSQKKTNTQTTPATLTAFLTSPEMIQLVRDVTVAGKTEGSKLRTSTATHLHSGLTRCKALLTSAKAAVTQLQQQLLSFSSSLLYHQQLITILPQSCASWAQHSLKHGSI